MAKTSKAACSGKLFRWREKFAGMTTKKAIVTFWRDCLSQTRPGFSEKSRWNRVN